MNAEMSVRRLLLGALGLAAWGAMFSLVRADEPAAAPSEPPAAASEAAPAAAPAAPPAKGLTRVAKDHDIWIDMERKIVVIDGRIAIREGQLEMFACPKNTKEHESIVALNTKAYLVHAALLAVGARSGTPVRYDPAYQPASGQIVDVWVLWKDAEGKPQRVRAQEWVRIVGKEETMSHDWVFAGSGFWVDEDTGDRHYLAESGDLICVSNFPTATLDLPVKSSQDNAQLMFEAFTEKIPPRDTPVRLVLAPRPEPKSAAPPAAEGGEPNGASAPPTE